MSKEMIPKFAVVVFFVTVVGLLIGRRFDIPPQELVIVVASQNSNFTEGQKLKRGAIIETNDGEYLAMQIGNDLLVGIDERSRVELHRIFFDERTLRFSRGRVEIVSESQTPVFIETNKTLNTLENGRGIFINYDYQKLVTVAPVKGSIQTQIKGKKDYLLIPVALNISETEPVSFSKTNVDPTQGPSAAFHDWFEKMINR